MSYVQGEDRGQAALLPAAIEDYVAAGKIEYLYVDLGTISGTAASFLAAGVPPATLITASAHIHDNIMRAGLNYKF